MAPPGTHKRFQKMQHSCQKLTWINDTTNTLTRKLKNTESHKHVSDVEAKKVFLAPWMRSSRRFVCNWAWD